MMRAALALALLSAIFAGCVASEAGAGEAGPSGGGAAGPAEFDDATGAVEGLVTDVELNPVPNAQAALLKNDLLENDVVAISDAQGRFTLSRVPPGTHTLAVQALGYGAAAKKIEVVAGQSAQVSIALEVLAVDEPYSIIDIRKAAVSGGMLKLTPQCMYDVGGTGNPLVKTCQGVRLACEPSANCEVHYANTLEKNPEWKTILAEVTWTSQSGVTGRGFMFDVTAPNVTRGQGGSINQGSPYTFFKMAPKPPIIWKIDETVLNERKIPEKDWCCDWFYRLFPGYCDLGSQIGNCETTPDYGVGYQNSATVYMSFFFKAPASLDYTALPDK